MDQEALNTGLRIGEMKVTKFFSWQDIGLCLRFYRLAEFSDYTWAFDIQILFFSVWIQFIKK